MPGVDFGLGGEMGAGEEDGEAALVGVFAGSSFIRVGDPTGAGLWVLFDAWVSVTLTSSPFFLNFRRPLTLVEGVFKDSVDCPRYEGNKNGRYDDSYVIAGRDGPPTLAPV